MSLSVIVRPAAMSSMENSCRCMLLLVRQSTLPLLGVCLSGRKETNFRVGPVSLHRVRSQASVVYAVRELFEASSPKQRADTCL